MGNEAKKPRTVTLHHEGLGRDHVVPNNPRLLRVLAKSGWKPKGEAKPAAKTAASGDKT